MFLGKIKKIIISSFIFGLIVFCPLDKLFALEISNDFPELKISEEDSKLTIGEIEKIFELYVDENNLGIKKGTPEYLEYIYNQMLYGEDEKLANHPKKDLIKDYFTEYIIACQGIEGSYEEPNQSESISIDLENKDKTIPQIREEVILQDSEVQKQENKGRRSKRSVSGYSPRVAVAYADSYTSRRNKAYPSYIYNCTNYVSQCLYAGGMPMKKLTPLPGGTNETTKYWYCGTPYHKSNVSTSWMRVTDFYSYWAPKVSDVNYTEDTSVSKNGKVGDVVLFRNAKTGKKYHAMIITKKDKNQVYLNGNTTNRKQYPISEYSDSENDWTLLSF
jgi:hypothetical protein